VHIALHSSLGLPCSLCCSMLRLNNMLLFLCAYDCKECTTVALYSVTGEHKHGFSRSCRWCCSRAVAPYCMFVFFATLATASGRLLATAAACKELAVL
jgi:hypothetical protein